MDGLRRALAALTCALAGAAPLVASAQTGAAVTSPAASVTGTVMAGSRSGHPAASRALRHASRACAAGTSLMNGLFAGLADTPRSSGIQDHFHFGARVQTVCLLGDHDIAVRLRQDG